MSFSTKASIKEYAGKVTGTEFVILDLLKRGGSERDPKRFQIDEICEWAGADNSLKTPIFEALTNLKDKGLINEEFLIGKGPKGFEGQATKFTWISENGRELLRCIYDDKRVRARALLLGIETIMSHNPTYRHIETIEKLYLDLNAGKLAFIMNKRA